MRLRLFCVMIVALALRAQQEKAPLTLDSYSTAFYSGEPEKNGGGYGLQSLVVFPFSGPSYTVRLPFAIGSMTQTPDGRVLFAEADYAEIALEFKTSGAPSRPGLFRFELGSMRMSSVPVDPNLAVFALAISQRQDKLIVSGRFREGGAQTCGLFEVALPGGAVKSILERPYCEYLESWAELSLSPEGERLLANRKGDLEIIDLGERSVRPLGKYATATWSPDGKWIAVIHNGSGDILDADTLVKRRHISGDLTGAWSPDSRYLIGSTHRGCGFSYGFTLQAVDVATGARQTIESSKCRVNRATIVWVHRAPPASDGRRFGVRKP